MQDIVDRLGAKPIAIQLPIGSENNFKGLVDLVRMKGVVWEEEKLDAKFIDIDIPEDMVEKAKEYREKLLESAVELDDEVLAAYLDGNEPDEATLKRMIRKAVLTGAFFPCCAGRPSKNKGVQPLLDGGGGLSAVAGRRACHQGHRRRRQRSDQASNDKERWRCLRSRSWTTRLSAPSPFAGSIPARCCRAPASSIRRATARSASAACC